MLNENSENVHSPAHQADSQTSESAQRTPPPSSPPPSVTPKQAGIFVESFKVVLLAVIIVLPVRIFIAQPFVVSGESMQPTFENGQYLIIDQLSYRLHEPKRGDVIIFRFPLEPSKFFIKRVIGLPEETVVIQGKVVIIINEEHPDGMVLDEEYVSSQNNSKNEANTTTLSLGEYFVMGDNRRESSDSRAWGTLPRENIIGTVFVRLLPINTFELFPGE